MSRLNVRLHVQGEVPASASLEALDLMRHQLLRDLSLRGPGRRVVVHPLDQELRSPILYGSWPKKWLKGILSVLSVTLSARSAG